MEQKMLYNCLIAKQFSFQHNQYMTGINVIQYSIKEIEIPADFRNIIWIRWIVHEVCSQTLLNIIPSAFRSNCGSIKIRLNFLRQCIMSYRNCLDNENC